MARSNFAGRSVGTGVGDSFERGWRGISAKSLGNCLSRVGAPVRWTLRRDSRRPRQPAATHADRQKSRPKTRSTPIWSRVLPNSASAADVSPRMRRGH